MSRSRIRVCSAYVDTGLSRVICAVSVAFSQLVGGQFDIENNFIISDPNSLVHMLTLMDSCSTTLQVFLPS